MSRGRRHHGEGAPRPGGWPSASTAIHRQARRVLLACHPPDVGRLAQALQRSGLVPILAFSPDEVGVVLDCCPVDAVVLDGALPGLGADRGCAMVRARTDAPVALLDSQQPPAAASSDVADLLLDRHLGHDEIAVRVDMLAGAAAAVTPPPASWQRGPLALDPATRVASWRGRALPTTAAQFDLLVVLVRAGGAAVPTEDLAGALHGRHGHDDEGRVRAHVMRLRKRLVAAGDEPPGVIVTVRGYGYRLDAQRDVATGPPEPRARISDAAGG